MTVNSPEARNWFYLLLNLASIAFVITALAYAVVPVLEDKAAAVGNAPPPSAIRDALRRDGWLWLLIEAAVIAVLALASMGLDRWRRWRNG
jgi:formate hydrogenlyase subunit 3/multisubunit Na+/H+ antiporter MnhD subunit